jgi:hypothetical protein
VSFFEITEGAIGPGEVLDLELAAPAGIDLTAVTRAVQVTLRAESGAESVLSPWSTVSTTASLWRIRYSPTGIEFAGMSACWLLVDATLGGTLYRYRAVEGRVIPRIGR